jgi:hypothetical protein
MSIYIFGGIIDGGNFMMACCDGDEKEKTLASNLDGISGWFVRWVSLYTLPTR